MGKLKQIYSKLVRRKLVLDSDLESTQLARVLTTYDLTFMGIGATLGVGIYVLAGSVAREIAGPAVIISFLIAAIASAFAGICYAEFAARIPKAGSAYVYSYVTIGEFVAFVIGWNLILEYIIGAASVAKGLSTYVDSLTNNSMRGVFEGAMFMDVEFLSSYPDFFAFGVAVIFSIALAFGMKESSLINNGCTIINLCVVVFVIVAGAINAHPHNWSIPFEDIPTNITHAGSGGFAPFGFTGIIKGAATCFYGFVGFDCVATTGEEAKTPQRSIPLAVVASLLVIFLSYFGISTVLTLMWPYYLQDPNAPLTFVFQEIGWDAARWVVSAGAVFGLLPSLLGSLYPLPRILYAMANDGLLFAPLGWVHKKYKSPVLGTLLSGFLTGLMGLLFNLQQLVEMMSIGTLMAYSIVSASVLILRYHKSDEDSENSIVPSNKTILQCIRNFFNMSKCQTPNDVTAAMVSVSIIAYGVFSLSAMVVIIFLPSELGSGEGWAVALLVILLLLAATCIVGIARQPRSKKKLFFMVPLVPYIPAISLMMNLYLMVMLDSMTWLRFAVWMVVGLVIYIFYGYKHSVADSISENSVHLQGESSKGESSTNIATNITNARNSSNSM